MLIVVIWVLMILAAAWSAGDKTAPLHGFIVSNSLASGVVAVVISAVMFTLARRAVTRRTRR